VMNGAGVPCGPVNRVDEVFADPQVRYSKIAKSVDHPRLGSLTLVAQPVEIVGIENDIRLPAPDLGEHSREILRDYGYRPDEIERLGQSGVI
jgi:crotonobetainyl-CoA:carnitine CoA-transferase CaiB-like acyl-CoA transferase